jgi:hypothetical protein
MTMNVALTLSADNKAMLVYDQPLGFAPSWVECSADGEGLRIMSEDGREVRVGGFYKDICGKFGEICDVLVVRMEKNEPAEGCRVPFISQRY